MGKRKHYVQSKKNPEPPMEKGAKDPEPKTGVVVNTKFVRLRLGPSLESEVLGELEQGTEVSIIPHVNHLGRLSVEVDFYKVLLSDGRVGYIKSDFIDLKEE